VVISSVCKILLFLESIRIQIQFRFNVFNVEIQIQWIWIYWINSKILDSDLTVIFLENYGLSPAQFVEFYYEKLMEFE